MSGIIKTAQEHRFITAGILGTVALGGTALIGAGAIAFLMVAGKFPPVHLSGLKMMLPVSLAGGVGVGVGVTVELAVLGITTVLLFKTLPSENKKTDLAHVPNHWGGENYTLEVGSPVKPFFYKACTVKYLLQVGELAIWKELPVPKDQAVPKDQDYMIFHKEKDEVRFIYIKNTGVINDDLAIKAALGCDYEPSNVVSVDDVVKSGKKAAQSADVEKPKGITFQDDHGRKWNVRRVEDSNNSSFTFTFAHANDVLYGITRSLE